MLRFRRTTPENTERFKFLKHTEDLLPQLQKQLERILDSYGKLSTIIYDTQGIRDEGVDVAIRRQEDNGDYHSLIGLQIKTASDLLPKDYLQKLKSQWFESSLIKGLQQYYLVLCVDERAFKNKIRIIEAEFKNAPKTKVIEPTFADFFLGLTQERIDAYIRRAYTGGDIVIKKAQEAVQFPSRMTSAVLIYVTMRSYIEAPGPVDVPTVMAADILRNYHAALLRTAEAECAKYEEEIDVTEFDEFAEVDDNFTKQIVEDLDALGDGPLIVENDAVTVRFESVVPLLALATEALVRFEYTPEMLTPYLLDVLDLSV